MRATFARTAGVLVLGFKESKGVHQDGCVKMLLTKRQLPHITPDPISRNLECGAKMLRLGQESDSEIHTDYRRATLRQCECVSSVPATDVNKS